MTKSFLDIVRTIHGDDTYGATPRTRSTDMGSGLPVSDSRTFMFTTGAECSYPTIDNGRVRRDMLEERGHYLRWNEDLALVKHLV